MSMRLTFASLAALVCATPALGADANSGKTFFRAQCALCHSAEPNDNGGAQGPNLSGVIGRHAASSSGFSYTPALEDSKLTWDPGTLDHFLSSPTTATVAQDGSLLISDDGANVIYRTSYAQQSASNH